jgi:hypothetical protein
MRVCHVNLIAHVSRHCQDRDTGVGDFDGRPESGATGPHHDDGWGELVSE